MANQNEQIKANGFDYIARAAHLLENDASLEDVEQIAQTISARLSTSLSAGADWKAKAWARVPSAARAYVTRMMYRRDAYERLMVAADEIENALDAFVVALGDVEAMAENAEDEEIGDWVSDAQRAADSLDAIATNTRRRAEDRASKVRDRLAMTGLPKKS